MQAVQEVPKETYKEPKESTKEQPLKAKEDSVQPN